MSAATRQGQGGRIEGLIGLAAPVLDLVLAVGERISRAVGPEDHYYPIRAPGEAFELPAQGAQSSSTPDVD